MIYAAPPHHAWLWDESLTDGVRTRRCLGWVLDVALVTIATVSVWWVLALLGVITFGLSWPLLSLVPLIPFAYHTLFLTGSMSATPGQAAFGLIVRREADLGTPTFVQALISTLVFYLTLATSGLLLLVALVTDRKRTLHDLASGLVVVRAGALHALSLTNGLGSWNMPGGHPYS